MPLTTTQARCLVEALLSLALLVGLCPTPVTAASPERNANLLSLLVKAYPDFLDRAEGNELVWKDSTRMIFDDGQGAKQFDIMLDSPDLKDMFFMPYPLGRSGLPPGLNADPGRVRFLPFFNKMYGDCSKGEVIGNLVDVVWLPTKSGEKLKVSRINGVAERLQAVSNELDKLDDSFVQYLKPSAGTYNCRMIAGTKRMSTHGHGTAIDISTERTDYWLWNKPSPDGRIEYKNRIPWEVVEIFEKHGFIWGGKWYHYDTMHFEYRPEILAAGRQD